MLKHPAVTRQRIHSTLPRIQALIYTPRVKVDVAAWTVGAEPVPAEEAFRADYQPFAVGAAWGPLWDTTWFRVRGQVPKGWKGREVVVLMRLADSRGEGFTAEGLIYSEGRVVRALNRNREDIPVAARAKGGEAFEFYVEAAANSGANPMEVSDSEFLNLPEFGGKPYFQLHQCELVCVNREAFDFYYDFRVAAEAMDALGEDSQRGNELLYALNEAVNVFNENDPASIPAARAVLAGVMSKRNGETVHRTSGVGHAHIDTAWLWPLRETIRKCARTFSTALDYMEKYPEYVFVCSQAQQYAWMKAYYPEIFRGIKKAVKRGQWEPVGSMWIETDCNLASGESLVRQIVHGKRFFRDELGFETVDVWIPDVFGYAASMPQIMKKAGVDYFLTQKISWSQFNKFPHHTFLWEGIDGTRVFTHFPPANTYNADTGPRELLKGARNFREHGRATRSLLVYGFGDGGGGPSITMLEQAKRLKDFDGVPPLQLETAKEFFRKAEEDARDLPVWSGELYLEAHRGTYTTQAKNKRGNRKSELLLRDAEFFDLIGKVLSPKHREAAADPERAVYDVTGLGRKDASSHQAALDRAWKLVLLNQFHDIIPGSSIHWVYLDSDRDYETVRQLGESVVASSLAALASKIDSRGLKSPLFVGNTLGFHRTEVVDLPDGSPAVVDVPACGYRVVDAAEPGEADLVPVKVVENAKGLTLENGIIRARLNRKGQLTSLVLVESGREMVPAGAVGNLFQLHEDIPNFWDAWDVDVFYREKFQNLDQVDSMEVVDSHPLRAVVRVVRSFGSSRIEQEIVLRAGSPRLDFRNVVDWQERRKMLKVAFPAAVRSSRATYEIQYGHLDRPTHANTSWDLARFEVCAHKWVDLSEPGGGLAVLNDCKYGHDVWGNIIRISLLRAPIAPDPKADRGRHEFTFAVMPHGGDFRAARVIEQSYALNVPLVLKPMEATPGELPSERSFFQVDQPAIVLEAIKWSDDRKAMIVRMYESHGSRGRVRLSSALPFRTAHLANLLEEPGARLEVRNGAVELDFQPFEIITVRLEA